VTSSLTRALCAALLIVTATAGGAVADGSSPAAPAATDAATVPAEDAFVVDLRADGSARVTVTVPFDLTTEAEREAFRRLRDNETARAGVRDRFADRMAATATAAANSTDREMRTDDTAVTFATADGGDTGVVALSVTWHGLAAEADGDLAVTAPFADGFTTDRELVVRAPDGYVLSETSPTPAASNDTAARWGPNASFDGFRVVATPTDASSDSEAKASAGGGQPGFGAGVAVVALLAAVVIGRR